MPIQRPPRYVLLLKELQKFTPQDHPDYVPLAQALKKIESVSSYLNTRKREQIFQHQLVEAMSKVFGAPVELVLPHRQLLQEAKISFVEAKSKELDGNAYLLNDGILYTKTRSLVHKQQFKQLILFSEISNISKANPSALVISTKQGQTVELKFTTVQERDSFFAAANEEKNKNKSTVK